MYFFEKINQNDKPIARLDKWGPHCRPCGHQTEVRESYKNNCKA